MRVPIFVVVEFNIVNLALAPKISSMLVVVAFSIETRASKIVVKPFRVEAAEVKEVLTVRLSELVVVEFRTEILPSAIFVKPEKVEPV